MSIENGSPKVDIVKLRSKLDQMTERIVSHLKDRLRLPLNEIVYQANGVSVSDRPDISLFQFAIEGLESYHALLGRYNYPDQFPVLGQDLPKPKIDRIVSQQLLSPVNIDIKNDLLTFYVDFLRKYCKPDDDPNTYGGTVFIDATLVLLINERVNIGRLVSEAKIEKDPTIHEVSENENLLLSKLKDHDREKNLVAAARRFAGAIDLDPEMTEELFRWMIEKTIYIEIAYIQQMRTPSQVV